MRDSENNSCNSITSHIFGWPLASESQGNVSLGRSLYLSSGFTSVMSDWKRQHSVTLDPV